MTLIVSTTLKELESGRGQAVTAGGSLLPMSEVIRQAAAAHHYLVVSTTTPSARCIWGAAADLPRLRNESCCTPENVSAYERGAIGRCNELVGNSEFPDRDTAHAAAVLAGHVVAYLAGDQTAAVFAALRRRNGLADA